MNDLSRIIDDAATTILKYGNSLESIKIAVELACVQAQRLQLEESYHDTLSVLDRMGTK